MRTEIVYVCSVNFWRYVYLSLRTLLTSGTHFDTVKIFVVGANSSSWKFTDPRIQAIPVPDRSSIGQWGSYWGENKLHLSLSDADRVIYLDTDVMVLRPIDQVYENQSVDLIARPGVETYMGRYFNWDNWHRAMQLVGQADYPYYSPGFVVFQNGSHKRIEKPWCQVIHRILANEMPFPANKHAEMYAFSIAAAMAGLSHAPMADYHHRYAMIGESHSDAVVHHLGTPGFYRHYIPIEREIGLSTRRDLTVPRPFATEVHAVYVRLRHRIRSTLRKGRREASLEY